MALKDYNKPNNKELVEKLASITFSHKSSVYRWLNGEVTPPPIKQEIIAKYLKQSVEELFPQN